jgi:hypothetical protein
MFYVKLNMTGLYFTEFLVDLRLTLFLFVRFLYVSMRNLYSLQPILFVDDIDVGFLIGFLPFCATLESFCTLFVKRSRGQY